MAEGRIMKALSGFYYVETAEKIYACKGRGVFRNQKITPLVGDFVDFDPTENDEGYIQKIHERHNELIRPPIANVTQAIIVSAVAQPDFSALLLDRFIAFLEAKGIKPMIVMTKTDLLSLEDRKQLEKYQNDYQALGYDVHYLSLKMEHDLEPIKSALTNEITVLVGQSGAGKSSLLNRLHPNLQLKTNKISTSLGRGKHTTRHVELLEIHGGLVADTPGFSALELTDLAAEQLGDCFIEIKNLSGQCKFRGCLHDKEPGCSIKDAVETGDMKLYRYKHYLIFLHEILSRKPRYST